MITKEVEDQIAAKEIAIVEAQKRGDFVPIEALLDDDFREIGSSGKIFSKSEVLNAIREVQIVDYAFEDLRFLPVDQRCVILTYLATVTRSYQGHVESRRAYRSSTWVERNGSWRVIFHQASVLPALP